MTREVFLKSSDLRPRMRLRHKGGAVVTLDRRKSANDPGLPGVPFLPGWWLRDGQGGLADFVIDDQANGWTLENITFCESCGCPTNCDEGKYEAALARVERLTDALRSLLKGVEGMPDAGLADDPRNAWWSIAPSVIRAREVLGEVGE